MSTLAVSGNVVALPWELRREDAERLRSWLSICGALALIAGLAMPWLPLPIIERPIPAVAVAEPVQVLLEVPQRTPPPPPPPPPPPRAEVAATPKADPLPAARPEPAPTPATAAAPEPTPDARELAASAGLMTMRDTLADLRSAVDTGRLAATGTRDQGNPGAAASIDRGSLAARQGARSAGVNDSTLSRDTGGVALVARETTRVDAPAGSAGTATTTDGRSTDPRQRSIEDVRRVFDANKGAIFAIYHRALREDPALRGEVVLELLIAPGGAVSEIRVVASEMRDDGLLERLVGRIRMFDFGARDVAPTRISYPVHFLPG